MPVTRRTIARCCVLLAALLGWPALAPAQTLGQIVVQSRYGQPLRAEVPVTSARGHREGGLYGGIATPDAYKAMGIEFNPLLYSVRVAVESRKEGTVLVLTSSRPVQEPYLDLVVVLESAGGRAMRRFTALFDMQ